MYKNSCLILIIIYNKNKWTNSSLTVGIFTFFFNPWVYIFISISPTEFNPNEYASFLLDSNFIFIIHLFFIAFRERGKRRRERETLMWERNIDCLLSHTHLEIEPTTLECALIRNQTLNFSVYGTALQPTDPHQPGSNEYAFKTS